MARDVQRIFERGIFGALAAVMLLLLTVAPVQAAPSAQIIGPVGELTEIVAQFSNTVNVFAILAAAAVFGPAFAMWVILQIVKLTRETMKVAYTQALQMLQVVTQAMTVMVNLQSSIETATASQEASLALGRTLVERTAQVVNNSNFHTAANKELVDKVLVENRLERQQSQQLNDEYRKAFEGVTLQVSALTDALARVAENLSVSHPVAKQAAGSQEPVKVDAEVTLADFRDTSAIPIQVGGEKVSSMTETGETRRVEPPPMPKEKTD